MTERTLGHVKAAEDALLVGLASVVVNGSVAGRRLGNALTGARATKGVVTGADTIVVVTELGAVAVVLVVMVSSNGSGADTGGTGKRGGR